MAAGYGQYPQQMSMPYYGASSVPASGYAPYGAAAGAQGGHMPNPANMGYGGAAAYGQPQQQPQGAQAGIPPQAEGHDAANAAKGYDNNAIAAGYASAAAMQMRAQQQYAYNSAGQVASGAQMAAGYGVQYAPFSLYLLYICKSFACATGVRCLWWCRARTSECRGGRLCGR